MDNIFESIASIAKLHTEQRDLAAIWLKEPVMTTEGLKIRIAPDMKVKIQNEELVHCIGEPTHKIIACYGTLNSQFEITVINLLTNEPEQIKL